MDAWHAALVSEANTRHCEALKLKLFTQLDNVEPKQVLPGVVVVPNFLKALGFCPKEMLDMLTNVPQHPSDKELALDLRDDAPPILVQGDHPALQYRGNAIPRNKSFNQLDMEKGCLRYGYTGWQYRVALAHRSTKCLPKLHELVERLDMVMGWPQVNHVISTFLQNR